MMKDSLLYPGPMRIRGDFIDESDLEKPSFSEWSRFSYRIGDGDRRLRFKIGGLLGHFGLRIERCSKKGGAYFFRRILKGGL